MKAVDNTQMVPDLVMTLVGIDQIAYIKPVLAGNEFGYAVFAADGTQLAIFSTLEAAYYTAKQHNLEPVSIH